MNKRGFSAVLILFLVGVLFLGIAGYGFLSQDKFPQLTEKTQEVLSSPAPALTERQKNILEKKEEIKRRLNINDAQFEALLQMSADEDFDYDK